LVKLRFPKSSNSNPIIVIGAAIGDKLPATSGRIEILGGLTLMGIGVKILLEDMV